MCVSYWCTSKFTFSDDFSRSVFVKMRKTPKKTIKMLVDETNARMNIKRKSKLNTIRHCGKSSRMWCRFVHSMIVCKYSPPHRLWSHDRRRDRNATIIIIIITRVYLSFTPQGCCHCFTYLSAQSDYMNYIKSISHKKCSQERQTKHANSRRYKSTSGLDSFLTPLVTPYNKIC